MTEIVETLRRAREYIEEGWTQHTRQTNRRVCLVGAISLTLHRNAFWTSRDVKQVVYALDFSSLTAAYRFNDHSSLHAVLRQIDRTIAKLERRAWQERVEIALRESRLAHAQRDLGRNTPDVIPEAWTETKELMPLELEA